MGTVNLVRMKGSAHYEAQPGRKARWVGVLSHRWETAAQTPQVLDASSGCSSRFLDTLQQLCLVQCGCSWMHLHVSRLQHGP